MFFFGIMGISSAVKPVGTVQGICPACGGTTEFSVARSYSYFHFFFLPLFKFHVQYFAACPGCTRVYGLPKELGDDIRRGNVRFVDAGAAAPLPGFAEGLCPACGHRNPPGSAFCNRCGRPL